MNFQSKTVNEMDPVSQWLTRETGFLIKSFIFVPGIMEFNIFGIPYVSVSQTRGLYNCCNKQD